MFPLAVAMALLAIAVGAWRFSTPSDTSDSPRVFCRVNDRTVATVFRLDELVETVKREHKSAEVTYNDDNIEVRSPQVLMEFHTIPGRGVLLSDIVILKSFERIAPARFFGM
jgi:hypothetical protein